MKRYVAPAAVLSAAVCLFTGCTSSTAPKTDTPPPVTQPVAIAPMTQGTPTVPVPATQPVAAAPAWDAPIEGKPVYFHARADGVVVYVSKDDGGKLTWAAKEPQGLLYDDKGKNVGKVTGMTWELGDGSKITAEQAATMDKPGAMPCAFYTVKSHDGAKGKLTAVGYLKATDTDGGVPPTKAPDAAGKEEHVPYRATYVFYAGK